MWIEKHATNEGEVEKEERLVFAFDVSIQAMFPVLLNISLRSFLPFCRNFPSTAPEDGYIIYFLFSRWIASLLLTYFTSLLGVNTIIDLLSLNEHCVHGNVKFQYVKKEMSVVGRVLEAYRMK